MWLTKTISSFSNNSEEERDAIIEIGQIQTLNKENKEGEEDKEKEGMRRTKDES